MELSQKLLDSYADVLVKFALNNCKGIKKGDVVLLQVPECAKSMLASLRRSVLAAGGMPLIDYYPDDMAREYYELANDEQLDFFPSKLLRGKVDQVDHTISIIAETDKHELEGIPPQKMMRRQRAFKPYLEWRDEKEVHGKFTWTLALYGTEAMAKEVKLSLSDYWDQIIKACFLDLPDPVAKWQEVTAEVERVKERLNQLRINKVRVVAPGTDIVVGLGKERQWLGGSGRNIPSFEVFISPDWRKTEGKVTFTEPLYEYGNLIEGVVLEFKEGKVVQASARKGEAVLKEMLASENADKAGEFSLTDSRLSRITKFMGETLFDENVGGKFGNMHIAVGKAYKDSFPGDKAKLTAAEWDKMGYNDSVVHTDIVQTSDRTVTATLEDGKELVIYKDGKFTV